MGGAAIISWNLGVENLKYIADLDTSRVILTGVETMLCGIVAWVATIRHFIKEEQVEE